MYGRYFAFLFSDKRGTYIIFGLRLEIYIFEANVSLINIGYIINLIDYIVEEFIKR